MKKGQNFRFLEQFWDKIQILFKKLNFVLFSSDECSFKIPQALKCENWKINARPDLFPQKNLLAYLPI